MIQVIPCHIRHLDLLEFRDDEKEQLLSIEGVFGRIEEILAAATVTGTFISEGRVLCCAGFTQVWSGVADAWILPSVHVGQESLVFSRTMKKYIMTIQKSFNFHRIQTVALDTPMYHRWLTFLGFEKEGVLKQYAHNRVDYVQYARVR